MSVDQQFNTVNDKLQLLLKQYGRLQKENEKLKETLDGQKEKQAEMQARLEEAQQQVGILKIAAGGMSEKDKKEFEKRINNYIREVDKCISFLSQ